MGHRAGVPTCVRALTRGCARRDGGRARRRRCRVLRTRRASRLPRRRQQRAPERTEIAQALETVKADPNLGDRTHDQDAPLEAIDRDEAVAATRRGSRWIAGLVSLARTSRRGLLMWVAARRRWPDCWSSTSSASCARTRVLRRGEARSSHRRTCAIWTSDRKAFRRTSAPRPARCGTAANTARRWRCCTAECCRGSPTCTACPSAIRAPKATASRCAASHLTAERARVCVAPRDRVWQRVRVWRPGHPDGDRCTSCVTASRLRSIPPRRSRPIDARERRMTRSRIIVAARRRICSWRSSPGSRNNTDWVGHDGADASERGGAHNPFYAAQRFAEALGARTAWDRVVHGPPADAVIVLSALAVEPEREPARSARALGRDGRPAGRRRDAGWARRHEFELWSGIVRRVPDEPDDEPTEKPETEVGGRSVSAHSRRNTTGRRAALSETPTLFGCAISTACRSSTTRQATRCGRSATSPACRPCACRWAEAA